MASTIASLVIAGEANAASYFAAGKFKAAPVIANSKVPLSDARFLIV
jgi:hypothetical protein